MTSDAPGSLSVPAIRAHRQGRPSARDDGEVCLRNRGHRIPAPHRGDGERSQGSPGGRRRREAGAQVITTANIKEFAPLPDSIEVQRPNEFLCNLLDLDPSAFVEMLREQAADLFRLPVTFDSSSGSILRLAQRRGHIDNVAWMNRPTPGEIERMWGVMNRVADKMLRHVVMVLGHDPTDMSEQGVRCGGTGFLVETSEQQFLVTADHVVGDILGAGLVPVVVGVAGKNISAWKTIDREAKVDLATIEVPSTFDLSQLSRHPFSLTQWPPRRAQPGDSALLVGYQGHRRRPRAGTLDAGVALVEDFVVSSSERHFIVDDLEDERIRPRGRRPRSAGGMSGAPVFIPGNRRPEWVGILYEGKDTAGRFFVSHADFLRPDGCIDRTRIAWR